MQREVIPAELYIVLYFLRCLAWIPSQEAMPDLLFADTALMLRLVFNAHQIEFGITQRGSAQRKGERRNAPVDPEAISKNVAKLDLEEVRKFVVLMLKALWAKQPTVSPKGLFVIDGLCVEPGESTEGAGKTSRSKSVRTKDGLKTVNELTVGFKMVWMWSVEAQVPVAVSFGTAEVDERPFVAGLIQQAQEALGDRGKIGTLLLDRGFVDGPGLWAIREAGIRFVIPARHDMNVCDEARLATTNEVVTHKLHRKSRTRLVKHRRRWAASATRTFIATTSSPTGSTWWCSRGRTLLTNGPVNNPLAVLDDYDERSKIENQGHRVLTADPR